MVIAQKKTIWSRFEDVYMMNAVVCLYILGIQAHAHTHTHLINA